MLQGTGSGRVVPMASARAQCLSLTALAQMTASVRELRVLGTLSLRPTAAIGQD